MPEMSSLVIFRRIGGSPPIDFSDAWPVRISLVKTNSFHSLESGLLRRTGILLNEPAQT